MKVLRRLQGITYWVIEDPKEIGELVSANIRKEWESDIRAQGEDHEHGSWLRSLRRRTWVLKIVSLEEVRLGDNIMGFVNRKTGYSFRQRLEERKKILSHDLDEFGAVIRPVILRAEDNQLMDGYCRYHVLSDRKVTKTWAYVGALKSSSRA